MLDAEQQECQTIRPEKCDNLPELCMVKKPRKQTPSREKQKTGKTIYADKSQEESKEISPADSTLEDVVQSAPKICTATLKQHATTQ